VTPFESLRIKTVTSKGFPRTLVGGVQEVVRRGQVRELFDGVPVLLLAEIPYMMAKFAVFDATSKLAFAVYPQATESVTLSLVVSLLSGMVAGVAASFVSQPSDTILVAVSGESSSSSSSSEPAAAAAGSAAAAINALDAAAMTAGEGVLSGGSSTTTASTAASSSSRVDIPAIVREVLREGGLAGFYKGAVPRAIKSAINIALQFFLYDSCKRLAHVGPDDIKVFFDVMSGLEIGLKDAAPMEVVAKMIETNVR
jgi:Mitochondrial carrier protein